MRVLGVAFDESKADAQAVGPDGRVKDRGPWELKVECDREDVLHLARYARAQGKEAVAQEYEKLIGETATISWIERHPFATGVGIGLATAAAATGGFFLGRGIYRRMQAKKMAAPAGRGRLAVAR